MKHLSAVLTDRICLPLMIMVGMVFTKSKYIEEIISSLFFFFLFQDYFNLCCDQKSEIQNVEIIKMFASEIALHFPAVQRTL